MCTYKKKSAIAFSHQESSGITYNYSVRTKTKLAVSWHKKYIIFPIVRVRGELPKSFIVFNSENTESKTDHWETQSP